jgi:VIT1/CCC1 family predicted Fe2+/Mn2+ transporter
MSTSGCAESGAHARAVAVDEVEHARRHAGFFKDFREQMALSGASSDGFSTMVQPAASAGPTFAQIWFCGQFHGVIMPMTPIGFFHDAAAVAVIIFELEMSSCLRASIR